MYKKILVGLDNSKDAMDALKKALELSKRDNSEVIVFHSVIHHLSEVMPSVSFSGPSNGALSYLIHEDYINEGKKVLKEAEKIFANEGQKVQTRLIFDIPPEDYITKQTEEEHFDLIILGCKGKHSKLKRSLLGTIPDKVINNAPCDVLIIR